MSYKPNPLLLVSPAKKFRKIDASIQSFHPQWLKYHDSIPNDTLYHYTNLAGITGILENRNIRFTHTLAFDDPNELIYGQNLIKSVFSDVIGKEDCETKINIIKQLEAQFDTLDFMGYDFYVACFCEKNSLLSQWRAYSNNGRGYCIGIEINELTCISGILNNLNNNKYLCIRKVIYDENLQKKLVNNYLNTIVPVIVETLKNPSNQFEENLMLSMICIEAVNVLWDMLVVFKHSAFSEELEWRIIHATQRTHEMKYVKLKNSGTKLNPFRPIYFYQENHGKKQFPLKSLTYGPSLDPSQSKVFLEILINKISSDDHILIVPSNIKVKSPGFRYGQK